MMKVISTDDAPAAVGPYSQAVEIDGTVYVSGQIPVDPKTGSIPDNLPDQADRCLRNIRSILEAAGLGMKDMVKVNVYITDMSAFAEVNKVYAGFFEEPYPARVCVGVASLPKGVGLEIDAIAVRKRCSSD